jgi:hypothetical protein
MYQSAVTDVPLVARVPQFDKPCSGSQNDTNYTGVKLYVLFTLLVL